MTIEYITREKAEGIALFMPALQRSLMLSSDSASFIMICRDGFPHTSFDVAIVEDGCISYITNESLKEAVKVFLAGETETY